MPISQLVLIGGPPAVGKTRVLAHLERILERCACLDADEVWRIHPFEVTDATRALAERNITAVLRSYLESEYPIVVATWVLHRADLIERLLGNLAGAYQSARVLHLVASRESIEARLASEPERGRRLDHALERLEQIQALPYPK